MIEQFKEIEKSLQLAEKAILKLDSLFGSIFANFIIIDDCYENRFYLQRTTIDHINSYLAIAKYQNERLRFISDKLINNPKLLDHEISVGLINELSMVDASLKDGLYGRPVDGFFHPKICNSINEILANDTSRNALTNWQDWKSFFEDCQMIVKQLIVLFPIQYTISSHLYTLNYGTKEILEHIIEQIKLETTTKILLDKSHDHQFQGHSAFFRLHIKRLQNQMIRAPLSISDGNHIVEKVNEIGNETGHLSKQKNNSDQEKRGK